jgi:hypothetical protein
MIEVLGKLPDKVDHPKREWMEAFLESPSRDLMTNVETSFRVLAVGDRLFPMTINDTEWDSSSDAFQGMRRCFAR